MDSLRAHFSSWGVSENGPREAPASPWQRHQASAEWPSPPKLPRLRETDPGSFPPNSPPLIGISKNQGPYFERFFKYWGSLVLGSLYERSYLGSILGAPTQVLETTIHVDSNSRALIRNSPARHVCEAEQGSSSLESSGRSNLHWWHKKRADHHVQQQLEAIAYSSCRS